MTSPINEIIMRLSKRAEQNDKVKLAATFVDAGPLFALLSNSDHQILYGRRGTGKTHAFSYLEEKKRDEGHMSIYIDLRNVGSSTGIYSDSRYSVPQRATRLLVDVFEAIHENLYTYFVASEEYDFSQMSPLLDLLADAITEVQVTGDFEQERASKTSDSSGLAQAVEASVSKESVGLLIKDSSDKKQENQSEYRVKETGVVEQRVQFGPLGKVLNDISKIIAGKKVWILIDEWSSVPANIQPYLADLLRRSVFPVNNFVVKIAAIERRSKFRVSVDNVEYIGFELGADVSSLDLDDFMVFDDNSERSVIFFKELLFKHVIEAEWPIKQRKPASADEFISQTFTQITTFEEFVRATEGVPRDAINILSLAAQRAVDDKISVEHVRTGARKWYQRDKENAIKGREEEHELLQWIITQVIGRRRARAFLLRSDKPNELIDMLFDSRLIHVLKQNISSRDEPGIRYDAYKLDYGCYVELITTTQAPLGAFLAEVENNQDIYVDVPPDDYRAIRRAILDIEEFNNRNRAAQLPLPGPFSTPPIPAATPDTQQSANE